MSPSEQKDAALPSDWSAALGASLAGALRGEQEPGATAHATRVLNQDEIDTLMAGGQSGQSGLERIISAGLVSYDRLPMLEIMFDRLVRIMSTSLRNFTWDNVEVAIDNIASQRFGDYLESMPLPAMMGVFKVREWDTYGLIVLDSAMIYSVVDVLLGGRRGTSAMRVEGRPYTTIERTLVQRLLNVVLADISTAFAPLAKVQFEFDRLEVNPRFAMITRHANACILARLRVEMEDRGGKIEILMPYASLEPVREVLLQQFMGEKFGRDSIWETHLAQELRHTDVALDVVLHQQVMPLSTILDLKIGDRLVLDSKPNAPVSLQCGQVPLFSAELGQVEGRPSVRIAETLLSAGVAA
jgi:flagellar motor switch protein FliM